MALAVADATAARAWGIAAYPADDGPEHPRHVPAGHAKPLLEKLEVPRDAVPARSSGKGQGRIGLHHQLPERRLSPPEREMSPLCAWGCRRHLA